MADICYPQKFYIEFRNFYATKDLLFINSLGGIETIRLRGEIDASADYVRTQAQKIETPEYFTNGVAQPQIEDIFSTEQMSFTGDTGFMPMENLDRLRDLFINKKAFEIKNGRLLPINISVKNTQWYTNRQSLYSISIQWQNAFVNEFYSPEGLLSVTGSCPAVESFAAIQSGRDKLTITWALETGYNKIQVEVIVSGNSTFSILEGTSGQQEISFDNPAVDLTGANITVKGSTICNDTADPEDIGPATTLTVRVYPNQAPVAVNDTFNLQSGYTSAVALKGSVLDNDYDPNGDEFKCVAASGATTASGSYTIDEDGYVTYTPPSDIYTGVDSFPYSITETGTGALTGSATVFINVTAAVTNNSTVYVKLSYRNSTASITHSATKVYFEVYLEFYSDAAGTNPVDVTGIGLNIGVRKTTDDSRTGTAIVNTTYPATGFEMKIFDGQYTEINSSYHWFISWLILPGTGYRAI